jgi:hypothetical protein
MNWNAHPYIYQIVHPWHWLGYGPNATNMAALSATIAAIATIAAALFAGKAYLSTVEQLRIANEQLRLSREQYDNEVRRFEEERAANRRVALTAYARTKAEEDSTRPAFREQGGWPMGIPRQTFQFKNIGPTAATQVRARSTISGEVLSEQAIVSAGASIPVTADTKEMLEQGVLLSFRTSFGSTWEILVRLLQSPVEEVRQVIRIYEPIELLSVEEVARQGAAKSR